MKHYSIAYWLIFLAVAEIVIEKVKLNPQNVINMNFSADISLYYDFYAFIIFSMQFNRFTRVGCNSSGKTCLGMFCKLKLISAKESRFDFGCKDGLIRSLNNIKVEKSYIIIAKFLMK